MTVTAEIPTTSTQLLSDLDTVLDEKSRHLPLAQNNTAATKSFLRESSFVKQDFISVTFKKGDVIVESGRLVSETLDANNDFNYSFVPLGFIVSGEIAILRGGKSTARLAEGDFIGLYESSDWLLTEQRREIGDWTLIATAETTIIFFGKDILTADTAAAKEFREYLISTARNEIIPQPITTLPLLDWVASHTTSSRLKGYAIVVNTHLLPNYVPFFRHLLYLAEFGRIFVLEKPYSTVPEAYRKLIESGCEVVQVRMEPGMPYEYSAQKSIEILWNKVTAEYKEYPFKDLLVISDGGDLLTSIPWEHLPDVQIAAVEQTQRGIARIENTTFHLPPVVSVASSGIKKILEAPFIARSVVEKLNELQIPSSGQRVGVIGMGSIGTSIVEQLEKQGVAVNFYDSAQQGASLAGSKISLDSLITDSDVIIGTTGKDALKGISVDRIEGHKTLISASSADVEFYTWLKFAPPAENPFGTRSFKIHDNLTIEILNGGYPINFDRSKNAVPSEDIVLTYALMYIATMQAAELIRRGSLEAKIYNVDKLAQKQLLREWLKRKGSGKDAASLSEDEIDTIVQFSSLEDGADSPSVWR